MTTAYPELNPTQRVLMGPGPSDVSADVLRALGSPTLGHLDPQYLEIMNQTRSMLQSVFQTKNEMTMAMSGTGSAGMEACFVNLIEPGDEVIVCVNGVFGMRMTDNAQRCGATVHTIERPWGESFDPSDIESVVKANPRAKILCIVHAETSTGAHQPLGEISKIVHDAGMLLLVDAVTSLGGIPVKVDDWRIDAIYSGTQKCLSCPPGLAPVSFSSAALERMGQRKTKVQSWYLDVSMLRKYWGEERVYHHTAPVNMTYALHRALSKVLTEGLDASYTRHMRNHKALRAGLEALGLSYIPANSLPMLNAIHVPDGIDEKQVRARLLNDFNIEIGAGLGPFKGKALRIGLMGAASTRANVTLFLGALEAILGDMGHAGSDGAARSAAAAVYAEA